MPRAARSDAQTAPVTAIGKEERIVQKRWLLLGEVEDGVAPRRFLLGKEDGAAMGRQQRSASASGGEATVHQGGGGGGGGHGVAVTAAAAATATRC